MNHGFVPALVLVSLVLGSCQDQGVHAISETRTATDPDRQLGQSSRQRFGGQAPSSSSTPDLRQPDAWQWQVPEGWQQMAASQFRLINLQHQADAQLQCYFSLIGGGGTAANVNRWRQQIGHAALSEEQIMALPKASLMGGEAVLVELQGSFAGMGGGPIEDARLMGLYLPLPNAAASVKMVGPAALVSAERQRFLDFAASIQIKGGQSNDHDHGDSQATGGGAKPKAGGNSAGRLQYQGPDGWSVGKGSSMRLVTFDVDGAPGTQCWVTPLAGDGGGVLANLNRWRGEMGQAAMTMDELGSLPELPVLSQSCRWLQVEGGYQGMGGEPTADALLFGVVVLQSNQALFIKMVGPKAVMQKQKANFQTFCSSLKEQG